MVLDKLKFNPQIGGKNLFATQGASFRTAGQPTQEVSGVEQYGTGQGINGLASNGVYGESWGTGKNGERRIDYYG
jgi:hypothetical protein